MRLPRLTHQTARSHQLLIQRPTSARSAHSASIALPVRRLMSEAGSTPTTPTTSKTIAHAPNLAGVDKLRIEELKVFRAGVHVVAPDLERHVVPDRQRRKVSRHGE